jgi:uncharacterized small protein (DUF1192 family)
MKKLISAVVVFLALITSHSASKVEKLERRIANLERTVNRLEAQVAKMSQADTAKKELLANKSKQRNKARARFQQDYKTYSRSQRREIEKLYQVANRKWKTPEARKSLEELIAKYGKANRTGCAILYLGQMSKGNEQLHYLKLAISDYSDCFYGNGVQVGAYARFYLACRYYREGKKAEARKLFQEISNKYPDAIDHRGNKLAAAISRYK